MSDTLIVVIGVVGFMIVLTGIVVWAYILARMVTRGILRSISEWKQGE